MMRVLFIGGTRRGCLTLEAMLASGTELAGVISLQQDAHEVDRCEGEMRRLGALANAPFFETRWMRERDYAAVISDLKVDLAVVVGCRILLPESILRVPRLGAVAVHDSLLPGYRGFAPVNWSVINGESQTGVTLFYISEAVDAGDVITQQTVAIGTDDTAAMVYERVCDATVDAVVKSLPLIAEGTAMRIPQQHGGASYTCKRTPVDGAIDWSRSTREIYNLVRGLSHPYPGAYTHFEGHQLRIWKARPLHDAPRYVGRVAGRVVSISSGDGTVDVLTADGVLRLFEVQMDGETPAAAASVIRSLRVTLGLDVGATLQRLAELEKEVRHLRTALTHVHRDDPVRV